MSTTISKKKRGKKAAAKKNTLDETTDSTQMEFVENQQPTQIECIICRDAYSNTRCPIVFNCGHSVCIACNKDIYNECPICKTVIKSRTKNFAMIQMLNCNEKFETKATNKLALFGKLAFAIYNTHDIIALLRQYTFTKDDSNVVKFIEAYKHILTLNPTFTEKKFSDVKFAKGLPLLQCNIIPIFTMFPQLNDLTIELIENYNCKFGIGCPTLNPIIIASIHNNTDILEYYLCKGENINFQNAVGFNALYFACKYSNTTSSIQTVQFLLSKGATLVYNKDPMMYLLDLIQCKTCTRAVVTLISEHVYKILENSITEVYSLQADDSDGTDDDEGEYYTGEVNQVFGEQPESSSDSNSDEEDPWSA